MKVFDYLRLLTSDDRTQIIVATHSPTIVEYATFDELFLLRPVELVEVGENQLVRVASDEDRLHFLRDVFGTTANLTAMQPLVVVEGTGEREGSKSVSDRKLYRALHPGFDRVTLIAGGGKGECIKLRAALGGALKVLSQHVKSIALLDRDLAVDAPPEGVIYLPVSMIENFLLDPDAMWEAIQSVIEKTGFKAVEELTAALDGVLDAMDGNETARRALRSLGIRIFRPEAPLEAIPQQAQQFSEALQSAYAAAKVDALKAKAAADVVALKEKHERREFYDGKAALQEFAKRHLHSSGMATGIFLYETARHARRRRKVTEFFDQFFKGDLPEVHAPVVTQPVAS